MLSPVETLPSFGPMPLKPPRRIIVNADDLGMSPDVNEAIFSLIDANFVTSATLLANGPAATEAVRRAHERPKTSFGVHLNLTFGSPFAPSRGLTPLLDAEGRFTRRVFDVRTSGSLVEAVTAEWSAQVAAVESLGLRISHLDSHEHVHTLPWAFAAFKRVQRRFGIRRARLTKNLYCRDMPARSRVLRIKKAAWNAGLRSWYRTRTTRWFADLHSVARALQERQVGPGVIEAMVHPGASDDPMMVNEVRELGEGVLGRLPFPVALISYHDL